MARKGIKLKIDELDTSIGLLKGVQIEIGRVVEEEWEELLGPTPFPDLTSLREWDFKLLSKYKPLYMPFCDLCCLCTFGKCDLSRDKRGACGIDMSTQQSRIVLLAACIGAATHTAHAHHLVEHFIEEYGRDYPIDIGPPEHIILEAPIARLVCGMRPKNLGDLEEILEYSENQITRLLTATHTGQEGSNLDFESKVFHAGMIDHLSMEAADIAQISVLDFPKGDPDAPLSDLGIGTVDLSKPVIMCVGHNVASGTGIIDYINESGLSGDVEVCGLCCTAHDLTRYGSKSAKIVGPMSWQLRFVRTGIPDVIIVDEQCVRTDLMVEAGKIGAPVIAVTEVNCQGLPNRTDEPADQIVEDLANGRMAGALILDTDKVGEVAVRVAQRVAPTRTDLKALPSMKGVVEEAKKCTHCRTCERACPNGLPISAAFESASKGEIAKLSELYDRCISCGRCEGACPVGIPIIGLISRASERVIKEEKFKVRTGRGPIRDTEIRGVGRDIVLGDIPGVVAFVGCANYANGGKEVAEMCEEFLRRRFIVITSGCAAMTIGMYKDEEGNTLYEKYTGEFDAGCLTNVGSCVSNAHIAGAAIKIANIFAKRNLRGNYAEIADYIHNRVGAVGVAWGAMSQKAASIAAGFWRLGVPVVVGPHGSKYRRMLLGRRERDDDWLVYDARTGDKVYVGPTPEHLFYAAETKEEAMVMMAKLCMRPNDTTKGRAVKLTHYADLHKRAYGTLPNDLHLFVRREADLPITLKEEMLRFLSEKEWKERTIPDPTLLPEKVYGRESADDEG